jgi:hypothetical protein
MVMAPLAGCTGSDSAGEPDPDMVVDPAPDPDPDPTSAQDCTLDTGVAGIEVILHDSDGEVVSTQYADEAGIATWDLCPPNAMASFVGLAGNKMLGMTLTGFGPDKHFQMRTTQMGILGTAHVVVPDDGGQLTKVRVNAGPGCSASTTKNSIQELTLNSTCVDTDNGMLPVLATAEIGDSHLYSYSKGAAIDIDNTVVDNMSSWTTGPSVSLQATNLSGPGVIFVSTSLRNGIVYDSETDSMEAPGGNASLNLPSPPSGFVTSRVMGIVVPNASGHLGLMRASNGFADSFDAATLPPAISGVAVDDINSNRPKVTLSGGSPSADLRLTVFNWVVQDQDVSWYILAPGDQPRASLPAMPEDLAGLAPDAAEFAGAVVIEASGESFESIMTAGYTFGASPMGCPDLAEGAECRYTLYTP